MTTEDLNSIIASGEADEFVRVCEGRQNKALSIIADEICARGGVRLVLLAGASSAGKTTTAKRLATQLRVNDRTAMHLSTDDYFVGDARNPRDENGEFDYETVECVDAERLAEDVNALLEGRSIKLRRFDFLKHEGFDEEKLSSLPADGVIVLEGIHALNPQLTRGISDEVKYRIFIEPQDELEVFGTTKLPSHEIRFLRRLVRDNQFRKMPPETTLKMWPKVRAGEEKWINPFRPLADVEFDSGLPYELAVLKSYVGGLLTVLVRKFPDDARIQTLNELVFSISPMDCLAVPGDSILRETIGGSQLEY